MYNYIHCLKCEIFRYFSLDFVTELYTKLFLIDTFVFNIKIHEKKNKLQINYCYNNTKISRKNLNINSFTKVPIKKYSKIFFNNSFKTTTINLITNKKLINFNFIKNFIIGFNGIYSLLDNQFSKFKLRGKTIGKGFAGTIKKYNFKRGPMSHGSKSHRISGSLGAGTNPGRVFPGKKMSGRLGFTYKTFNNVKIHGINILENFIYLSNIVPGKFNNKISLYF